MNEKKPLIIACIALGVIILAGGSLLYYFNFVVLPEQEKLLAGANAELAKAREKKALIPKIEASISDLRAQEVKKKTRIPDLDDKEYDGLALLLDDMRKRAGVDVAKGSYSIPKAAATTGRAGAAAGGASANVHKVQYDLGVKGGFHQLLRYLNMLEKDRRFINVESFSIAKGGAEGGAKGGNRGATQAIRELKVVITSYTYRQGAKPPKAIAKEDEGGISTDVPE